MMSKFWSAHNMSPAICLQGGEIKTTRYHGYLFHFRQTHITTMMSSCSLRLRMASSRSATAPRQSSSVVLPSLMMFSTGKSLAVAQRSKCLYLIRGDNQTTVKQIITSVFYWCLSGFLEEVNWSSRFTHLSALVTRYTSVNN